MKKFSLTLLLFTCLLFVSNAYSSWRQCITDISTISFNSVAISPSKIAVAIGDKGYYVISTNEGSNWSSNNLNSSNNLELVKDINDSSFIIIDDKNNYYLSSNNGNNWEKGNKSFNDKINAIEFLGEFGTAVANEGSIFTSDDYGRNWKLINKLIYEPLMDVCLARNKDVFVVGNKILKSTDKGLTWETLYKNNSGTFIKIHVLDSNIYVVDNKLNLYISNDYGKTWVKKAIEKNYYSMYARPQIVNFTIFTPDVITVRVYDFYSGCGVRQYDYVSKDTGNSWSRINLLGSSKYGDDIKSICILDKDYGLGVGDAGIIYKITMPEHIFLKYDRLKTGIPISFLGGVNCTQKIGQ